jgi:hypothetical protein
MWVLFAILRVNNSFSYRIFRSILVLVIISQLTLVSKLFLGGPVIEGEDGPTEVNALIQWKTFVWTISWSVFFDRFWCSYFSIDFGARDYFTTHLSFKTFLGGPVIEGEDGPTEVNALIQWKTFVWTISWSYLSSDSHHAKRILEFICWMVSLSLHYGSINQGRRHREVNSSIPSS